VKPVSMMPINGWFCWGRLGVISSLVFVSVIAYLNCDRPKVRSPDRSVHRPRRTVHKNQKPSSRSAASRSQGVKSSSSRLFNQPDRPLSRSPQKDSTQKSEAKFKLPQHRSPGGCETINNHSIAQKTRL